MNGQFEPFRNIHSADDLLLLDLPAETGATIRFPSSPYYAEICLWVTIQCSEEDLFSCDGQTLMHAVPEQGRGWRLTLTPYGYLRFEDDDPTANEPRVVDSFLPVHTLVAGDKPFQVGLCMGGESWLHRETRYGGESGSSRLRLFVVPELGGPISEIGGAERIDRRDMNPIPSICTLGGDSEGRRPFAGRIERITAYNTCRLELFDGPQRASARDHMPLIPGGSTFAPRWVDGETVEVFTRPEFTTTESYWVYLSLSALPEHCRRLRVWTKWVGGRNMTPTFFWSRDGDAWERVVPSRVLSSDGRNFRAEFTIAGPLRDGGYLASCPPFTTASREALLAWAQQQPDTEVIRIGATVQGRPIHVIRIGRGDDGPGRGGCAIICGQHSPLEIMGAHLIRPTIEHLLRRPELLNRCNFYFIPTVNVDCQYFGGNGLNVNRRNTNRHWLVDIEPENRGCVDYFEALREAGQRIDLAIDVHAGGTFRNHVLMYMARDEKQQGPPLDAERLARQEQWRDLLETHAGLRRADSRKLPQQDFRATDYFPQRHGAVGLCLELSTCSYYDSIVGHSKPFGEETFEVLARGLVQSCAAWWEA